MRPFFSIGVTTYNRKEMLKECLSSAIWQTFSDFELIVGNDYPQENISAELLGIHDPRIRFVNHAQNLGELRNMNALLAMSRGRYFTWLGDDDMYVPTFLQAVHAALVKFDFPPCVFTSYMRDAIFPEEVETSPAEGQLFEGRRFLQLYLTRTLKTLGSNGVFKKEYIMRIGGMEQLGASFSPYSDNLLAIRAGLLDKVVYIDAPLSFFRTHEESISATSTDLDAYSSAQAALCRKCINIFKSEGLRDNFHSNLFLLLWWCIIDFAAVILRAGSINKRQVFAYLAFLKRYMSFLKRPTLYWRRIGFLIITIIIQVLSLGKDKLRALAVRKKRFK